MNRQNVIHIAAVILCLTSQVCATDDSGGKTRYDMEYADVGGVSLKLDAFVPAGDGPFPACILVHGGGFTKGNKQSYIKPLFNPLGDAGFAWFSIDYRLAPEHRWPACAEDLEAAIRWVKSHAAEFNVDPNQIVLIGESAGGYLTGYVGAKGTGETRVAAVVCLYAALDREFQTQHFNKLGGSTAALLGVSELNDDTWQRLRDMSANRFINANMPPVLLVHGEQDDQVPLAQSVRFQKEMAKNGAPCELITIPGGGHGMQGWEKLNSDYKSQLIDWLRRTLEPQYESSR